MIDPLRNGPFASSTLSPGSRALVTGLPEGSSDRPCRGRGPLVRWADPPDTITWIAGNTTFVGSQVAGGVLFGATSLRAEGPEGIWVGDTARREVSMWKGGEMHRFGS